MSLFKTNLTGVPSLTSPPPSLLFFRAPFTSHRSPLSERLEQATIKTKRQSNLGLLPKGGSHLFTLSFCNFKMSHLIQYLSYVHTVFGFQLLLTRSILNSRKIKTIPNFNFAKYMTSSIMILTYQVS